MLSTIPGILERYKVSSIFFHSSSDINTAYAGQNGSQGYLYSDTQIGAGGSGGATYKFDRSTGRILSIIDGGSAGGTNADGGNRRRHRGGRQCTACEKPWLAGPEKGVNGSGKCDFSWNYNNVGFCPVWLLRCKSLYRNADR